MSHIHDIYDGDTHFTIDDKMKIANADEVKALAQNDIGAERYTFEMPRYIEGHDMSLCNKVEVHYNNIQNYDSSTRTTVENKSFDEIEDFQISPDDENVVICSWLIQGDATQLDGTLNFCLRFACMDGDIIEYQKFTDIFEGVPVRKTIWNTEKVATNNADVLKKWYNEMVELASEREILFAEYGVTPFLDMYNAYTHENKMVFLRQPTGAQSVFVLSHAEYSKLYFARTLDTNKTVEEITVTRQNVWSAISKTSYNIKPKERKQKVMHVNAESTLRLQVGHSYLIQCRGEGKAILTDNMVVWNDGPLEAKWMQITVGGLNDSIDGIMSNTSSDNKVFFLAMGENRIDEETNTWGDRNIRRGVAYMPNNNNAFAKVVIPADSYLTDTYTE